MATLQGSRNATKADVYWLVGWTAVLLWDNVITISAAHRYLMKAKSTPMKALYILNRYGTVVFQTICMFMVVLAVPMNLCRSIFWFQAFALVYVISICSFIVSIRCWALFQRSRRMMILLGSMLFIELGVLIGTVSQLRPLVLTPGAVAILDFQGCVAVAPNPLGRQLSLVFWSSTLAFNTIVFALTMWKSIALTRRIAQHLTFWRRISKGGMLYYSVIVGTNIGCLVFYAQTTKPLQTYNTPASVVLVSLMSSRLIVSLWNENYRNSRLAFDSLATLHSPRDDDDHPRSVSSPKSGHSERGGRTKSRRNSDDYDKLGPFESVKIDMSDFKASLPTLSYSGVSHYHHHRRRSGSIHSRHGSISSLPKFDGLVFRNEEPCDEEIKLDSRSVRSEGASKNPKAKVGGTREGTASV